MSFVAWGRDFRTLYDRFGARPCVVTEKRTWTYAEVLGRAATLARDLKAAGVKPGESVATFVPNEAAAIWASYGATLAGAAETPLGTQLSPSDIEHCVKLAGTRHVVVVDEQAADRFRKLGCQVHMATDAALELSSISPNDHVVGEQHGKIVFTSGTTGLAKAIVHSHFRRWLANLLLRAHLPKTPDGQSCILLMTPFVHGASLLTYAYLDHGAAIYLMDGVHTDRVRELLKRRAVTAMFAPPTVLAKLTAAFEGERYDCLQTIFCGTATLEPVVYERAKNIFGPIVRVTYGKTETFNPITVLPPDACDAFYARPRNKLGTCLGWPASGVEVRIGDDESNPVDGDTPGEIYIRSPHEMVGYIDQSGFHPVAEDEWHATGDIGWIANDGTLMLAGRAHDVIKSGGYKIYPQELEAVLGSAVAPALIAAVGVPSTYWGQVVVAVAETPDTSWEANAATAAEKLAKYKRPRAFVSVSTFPRGGQDKVRRDKLVEMLMQHYRLEDGPHPKLVAR